MSGETVARCTNCGGTYKPGDQKCPYCGYYITSLGRAIAILRAPSPTPTTSLAAANNSRVAAETETAHHYQSVFLIILFFAITLLGIALSNPDPKQTEQALALMANALPIFLFVGLAGIAMRMGSKI
jgi:hypothetical protein